VSSGKYRLTESDARSATRRSTGSLTKRRAGRNCGVTFAAERHRVLGAFHERTRAIGERDARGADAQRLRAVFVREAQPHAIAACAQAHDLADGLVREARCRREALSRGARWQRRSAPAADPRGGLRDGGERQREQRAQDQCTAPSSFVYSKFFEGESCVAVH